MGGKHKGDLRYRDQTFLERIIEEFETYADRILISYGEDIRKEYPDCVTVCDEYPGCGPIGGIHAGLKKCESDSVMVAACDMPFVKMELYHLLERELENARQKSGESYAGAVPEADGRIHPLAAVYRKEMLPCLEEQIARKDYRIRDVLKRQNILYVDVSGEPQIRQMLKNVNTVLEYEELSKQKIIAVCGVKNSGKTTLLERLVRELSGRGMKVAVIKHDGHDFDCDIPGTDSYRLGEAGAYGTAVFSGSRCFVHKKGTGEREEELMRLFPEADIIFLEGMKDSRYPKIEVIREGVSVHPVSNPEGRFLIVTDRDAGEYQEKTARFEDIAGIAGEILGIHASSPCTFCAKTL